ncbi:MAG TPA: DUF1385 domain-containing protein [Anaerolineales bacterium]|nr:DUF1385 domain-containing protein [Anaerolineales bacterium]
MRPALPVYGGQAVIEGVMMRGSRAFAIAVRAPDHSITVKTESLGGLYRHPAGRFPFLRGLLLLWDALGLGMRALAFSADVQMGETQKPQPASMALTMATAILLGLGLFFLLPAAVGYAAEQLLGVSAIAANLIEGLTRLLLLVGYVWVIGFWGEIRRVYAYHGAEHKTINAFEAGAPLTAESVARFPLEHPRCGTAFLLTVAVMSIVLFSALGPLALLPRLASRIVLVPVVAGLAYEYIRLTARFASRRWAQALITPNLALQRLTTREPSADMLEVAIAAFEAMRAGEPAPARPADSPTPAL